MKRVLIGSIAVAALLVTFPGAQMRVVPVDELQGHAALGLAAAPPRQHRHRDGSHGASRRRGQRAAGDAQSGTGLPDGARDGDARERRAERDRPRDLRSAGRAADAGACGAASVRRRRAVLHARRGLRLLVQHRRDVREVGQGRDHRRLRAPDPHDPPGRRLRDEPDRRQRGPAPQRVGGALARRLQAGRRRDQVPRADQGRAAALAAEEVLLLRGVRPGRRRVREADAGQLVAVRRACSARPTRTSEPKRAACTSARAWRSCWRCRDRRRGTTS